MGEIPLGLTAHAPQGLTGDTAAVPIVRSNVRLSGGILDRVVVTGVAAITDLGKLVYASDDDVLTLTRPTRGLPLGVGPH